MMTQYIEILEPAKLRPKDLKVYTKPTMKKWGVCKLRRLVIAGADVKFNDAPDLPRVGIATEDTSDFYGCFDNCYEVIE